MADIELTVTASIPANTSASIKVYEDTDNDGAAEATATQALLDGTQTYTLSGFTGGTSTGYDYWWELTTFSTSDPSVTPSINSVDIDTAPGGGTTSTSITENAAGQDDFSAVVVSSNSVVEGASSNDSYNSSTTLGSSESITENSVGQDTFSVVVNSPNSLTEGASSGDVYSNGSSTERTWPSSLPQRPLIDGFKENAPNNVVRTQMDHGPKNIRRRSTSNVRRMSVRFIMDSTQLETFDSFYNNTTKGGALRFDFTDPRTKTTKQFRFRGNQPAYQALGAGFYHVEVEIELLP